MPKQPPDGLISYYGQSFWSLTPGLIAKKGLNGLIVEHEAVHQRGLNVEADPLRVWVRPAVGDLFGDFTLSFSEINHEGMAGENAFQVVHGPAYIR